MIANEDFWEDLLDLIESGNVLPVVGQGVTTINADNELLCQWLTKQLAINLDIPAESLPENPELHDVVCRLMIRDGSCQKAYQRISRILSREAPEPGVTLRQLAAINGFRLFLSTTFDSLLERTINEQRYDSQPVTRVCAFSPRGETIDLPTRYSSLNSTTVFHLLGKASSVVGSYVIWEDDMLEFICELHKNLPSVLKNLSLDLADTKFHYLVLGLNFSDWLVRFFLRVARQSQFAGDISRVDFLADHPGAALPDNLVMFFGSVLKNVQVVPCDPREFVSELSQRWAARHPEGYKKDSPLPAVRNQMPRGAIFVSYAREDEAAARKLVAQLAEYGCDVWYDVQRLVTGSNYNNELEDEVKRYCGLFISVISANTEHQKEAYFHMERNWAAERAMRFADRGAEFYHPVVIDDDLSLGDIVREPRVFHTSQRTHLPGGEVSSAFGARLLELQRKYLRESE